MQCVEVVAVLIFAECGIMLSLVFVALVLRLSALMLSDQEVPPIRLFCWRVDLLQGNFGRASGQLAFICLHDSGKLILKLGGANDAVPGIGLRRPLDGDGLSAMRDGLNELTVDEFSWSGHLDNRLSTRRQELKVLVLCGQQQYCDWPLTTNRTGLSNGGWRASPFSIIDGGGKLCTD